MQKRTKIKMNDITVQSWRGGTPPVQNLEGQAPPLPPGSRAYAQDGTRKAGKWVARWKRVDGFVNMKAFRKHWLIVTETRREANTFPMWAALTYVD